MVKEKHIERQETMLLNLINGMKQKVHLDYTIFQNTNAKNDAFSHEVRLSVLIITCNSDIVTF